MAEFDDIIRLKDVELKPFSREDADDQYIGWLNDWEVIQYLAIVRRDRSVESLKKFVEDSIRNPDRYFFKICAIEDNLKIGTISVTKDPLHRIGAFAYMIGERSYWGGTWALQAQIGLFDFAFDTLALRKVHGSVVTANTGSNFSLRRLGFTREGILRGHYLLGPEGETVGDLAEYGCMAEDWKAFSVKFQELRGVANVKQS
jgi:RimJ/RimL family protein N-acetyltransferase